jgi:hypothetical protein|tara:strand:+ start:545 stop:730 length:186 start_codon:yes stop_codon:yes gene_type:complete
MRMNNETKILFALEHVAHLEDLFEENEWENYLIHPLSTIKIELERQLGNERARKTKKKTRD